MLISFKVEFINLDSNTYDGNYLSTGVNLSKKIKKIPIL
jgi:hypothetical protein